MLSDNKQQNYIIWHLLLKTKGSPNSLFSSITMLKFSTACLYNPFFISNIAWFKNAFVDNLFCCIIIFPLIFFWQMITSFLRSFFPCVAFACLIRSTKKSFRIKSKRSHRSILWIPRIPSFLCPFCFLHLLHQLWVLLCLWSLTLAEVKKWHRC